MPQVWHFRQSIDYSITANYAVLDFAQRYRENLLYNIYVMPAGTASPRQHRQLDDLSAPHRRSEGRDREGHEGRRRHRFAHGPRRPHRHGAGQVLLDCCKKPEYRDPRGYILSANEGDFLTATKFVNIMIKSGLTAHRATAPFTVGGKQYPAGSYVFKARAGRSARTCSTCSSRRITRTTSSIPAARRFRRTTTPAGRSRTRWA